MSRFDPYASNGGTILGIAGTDFAVVASDTRLSEGYSIHTRNCPKTYKLSDKSVLSCTGFYGDVLTLVKAVRARMISYKHIHQKEMSTPAIAQMLSTMLYGKRFFPYYVYNILVGIDENGKGLCYSYDPVGSYELEVFRAGGSASTLLQPLLDNQIGLKNQTGVERVPLTKEFVVKLVKDVFTSAGERDIYTGDEVEIKIITKDGVATERFSLRRD